MSGFLVQVGATVMCPHAGQVNIISTNTRVRVGGAFASTMADTFMVAGCPFQVPIGTGTKPQPCVTVQWLVPATRVRINGQFAILQTSTGLCKSAEQIPQGPPNVVAPQVRVRGM